MLKVENLTQTFGGVVAVSNFDLEVKPGAITAVIGPNGAGKTTLFNCVTGIYAPTAGRILFDGSEITGRAPHTIVAAGISRTFQNIRIFDGMTVFENVLIGRFVRGGTEKSAADAAIRILERLSLDHLCDAEAGSLAYGLKRRLEIARALAAEPKLLLLDEPAAGLNSSEKMELQKIVRELDLTVILIEHDMKFVMDLSGTVVVLDYGKKIAEGPPAEVRKNPAVIEAYLG